MPDTIKVADYTTRTTCRVCQSRNLEPLLSLGTQYVSDFITKEEIGIKGIKCPIELVMCDKCKLVQLKHTASQEFLYTRHYWYRSGVTLTMRNALKDIVESAAKATKLKEGDIVLDIGSNDGTLLRNYAWGITKIGIEPASNLQEEGSKGIDLLLNDFWDYSAYQEAKLAAGFISKAKVITAIGMFYDLEDPNQFIADVAKALDPNGVFIAQLMCLNNMIETCDIGNLAHEHLEFYSLTSLEYLLDQHGLEIYDVETNSTNNQSYRFFIRHIGSSVKPQNASGAAARIRYIRLDEEKLQSRVFYNLFSARIQSTKEVLVKFLETAKNAGKSIWIYGASTKGNVIIQWLGLDTKLITAAAERSPEKFDRYTIGSNIPILSEAEMREAMPDYCLVLPYTFMPEIIKREANEQWRINNGKFIQPLPEMKVL